MKTHSKYFGTMLILAVAFLASCKKNKAEPMPIDNGGIVVNTGNLSLATTYKVGGSDFSMDSTYQDGYGNAYKFTFLRFYLSKFRFTDHDEVSTYFPTQYVLLNPAISTYSLGLIEAEHYHDLYVNIGIDSITNHTDPNTYPATSPLYPQSPSMHWTWNSGYIFYKLEGIVDTNNDQNFDQTFSFHIGSDAFLRSITKTLHKEVVANQTNTINLTIDLDKFLTNINLKTEKATHTGDNLPLATKLADNSLTVFDFN